MAIKKEGRLIFSDLSANQRSAPEENLLRIYQALQHDAYHKDLQIEDAVVALFRLEGFYEDEIKMKGSHVQLRIRRRLMDKLLIKGGHHKGEALYHILKLK